MLVGNHKILKITIFLLILLFIYYILIYNPKNCSENLFLRSSSIFLPFLSFLTLLLALFLFKKENFMIKILIFFLLVFMLILNLYLNFLAGKSCLVLLISLGINSILIPFAAMLFYSKG